MINRGRLMKVHVKKLSRHRHFKLRRSCRLIVRNLILFIKADCGSGDEWRCYFQNKNSHFCSLFPFLEVRSNFNRKSKKVSLIAFTESEECAAKTRVAGDKLHDEEPNSLPFHLKS